MPDIIGLISDTHGLLRPEAVDALRGCDRIIHAGDVGSPDLLDNLQALAPVVAIRGNVDRGTWAESLPPTATLDLDGHRIYVIHAFGDLERWPAPAGASAVVFGHSHKPSIENRDGVMYLNPGSAGPRRFRLPVTVARLSVVEDKLAATIVDLTIT